MDDQSLQAIIEIMTLETADALAVGNGNHTDASFTDRDVALQLEQENWNTLRATLNDRRIARRIAGGVQQDWDALDVLPQEEDGASHDRGIAVTTADSANEATDAPQQPNPMTDETLDGADFTQKDSQIASNMDGNGNSTAEVPQQPNITTDELPEEAANPALAEGSSNTQSTESGCSPLEDMKEFGGNENVPEEPRLECLASVDAARSSVMSVVRGGKPASAPNTPKTGPHTEHPSATINGAGIGLMGRIGARSVIIS
ncbi:hypothetical protein FQN53_004916 [Emmonsiellopsis sp. PD_33]|nr:hypothetical protein FQN53_004916 [Emmonsiellopsis sp. PD_33]